MFLCMSYIIILQIMYSISNQSISSQEIVRKLYFLVVFLYEFFLFFLIFWLEMEIIKRRNKPKRHYHWMSSQLSENYNSINLYIAIYCWNGSKFSANRPSCSTEYIYNSRSLLRCKFLLFPLSCDPNCHIIYLP